MKTIKLRFCKLFFADIKIKPQSVLDINVSPCENVHHNKHCCDHLAA